jgi:predicted translin family RNA/ssDNA-binding protein
MASSPVNADEFASIIRSMQEEDEQREQLIKRSRDVLKCSKQAIYALQRGDTARAEDLIAQGKRGATELIVVTVTLPHLRYGALSSALEEWAEAAIFAVFLRERRIPTMAELEIVNREEYLGGVMDFCGEVNRFAVLAATRRDAAAVNAAREAVDRLLAQLMLFDFKNGNLRRKYGALRGRIPMRALPPPPLISPFPPPPCFADGVKYTLNKLEQVCYDLSLSSGG